MQKGLSTIFEYETPKVVTISNIRIGIIHRVLQLLIIIYCVCWAMIYEKGYQTFDTITSAVTTKVKGLSFTYDSITPTELHGPNKSRTNERIWDVVDYVYPALENNAFFVITNAIVTKRQTMSKCPSSDDDCASDAECPVDHIPNHKTGTYTGKCVDNTERGRKTCQILTWCPLENDKLVDPKSYMFTGIHNYTVLIKNNIEFKEFKVRRRNIQPWASKKFLRSCSYNKTHPEYKYCPIFNLSTIFAEAEVANDLFAKGGVIGIFINWQCNLDWNQRYCNPEYSFQRLDLNTTNVAAGFNFRYANYYTINGVEYRDLMKAFGVRFLLFIEGKAGKFHVLPLTMNIGSSLALLGLAPFLCDIIVLNLVGSRHVYQNAKFETVSEPGRRSRSTGGSFRSSTKRNGSYDKNSERVRSSQKLIHKEEESRDNTLRISGSSLPIISSNDSIPVITPSQMKMTGYCRGKRRSTKECCTI